MELTPINRRGKINLFFTKKTASFFICKRGRNQPASRSTFPTESNPELKSFTFYHSSFVKPCSCHYARLYARDASMYLLAATSAKPSHHREEVHSWGKAPGMVHSPAFIRSAVQH